MTTPKQQFAKHPYHEAFYDLTASDDFVTAVNYAMLEFIRKQPPSDVGASFRLDGAKDFQATLMKLADPETPSEAKTVGPDILRPDPKANAPSYRPNKPKDTK